jgi:hypothetical protein
MQFEKEKGFICLLATFKRKHGSVCEVTSGLLRYEPEHCDQFELEHVYALVTVRLLDRLCGLRPYRYSTEVHIRLCAVHMFPYELVTCECRNAVDISLTL